MFLCRYPLIFHPHNLTFSLFRAQDALVTKFQDRVAALTLPASAKVVFDEELEKLQVGCFDYSALIGTCNGAKVNNFFNHEYMLVLE